ncbi:MAG: LppX_LprAFG lipoprotein [Candidatus Dormiibacterota bacterium]
MRRALCVMVAALALSSCGGGGAPQPKAVDPAQALRDGAAAMAKLDTVTATLTFTKGVVTFQGFTLAGAKTSVRLPSDSDTTYTVKEQDLSLTIEVVITGGHVFVHVPFSGFQEFTGPNAAAIPDLAKLFDPSTGLPAVIPAGRTPKYLGLDQAGGVSSYRVSATYTADQVHAMLPQLSSGGDVQAVIWIGATDHLIRKATLDGAFGDGGKESSVEVDIAGFNSPVSITSPSP